MSKEPSIKILVGYHKPAVLLKDDVLTPIHLGRALATKASKDGTMSKEDYQWMLDNMIGDDTGDNISHLNREFCELSGIYWAWKNYDKLGNPDYIGFMHYRRHFIFNEKMRFPKKKLLNQLPIFPFITRGYLKQTGLKNISSYLKSNIILPKFIIPSQIHPSITSNLIHFCNYAKMPDFFEEMVKFVAQNNTYQKFADRILNDDKMIPGNMFILKKDIFFTYCQFLFDVCFHLRKHFDYFTSDDPEHLRQIAWTSEFVSTIFFEKSMEKFSTVMLPISYIDNTARFAFFKFTVKYIKYKLLSKLTMGKLRKKYKTKYKSLKEIINA